MVKMIAHIGLLIFMLSGITVKAQQKSIQLNLGTQGIGGEFKYGVSPGVSLRAGVNVVPLKANNVFKISDFRSTSNVSADFYNVHFLADYNPLKKISWLRLVGGFAYFFKANGGLRVTPTDNYTYGDLVLSGDQIGYLDLKIDWKGVAPYLGISLWHAFPDKKFGVNFDIGSYHLSRPEASIIGTGLLEGNSTQTPQLQSNIKNYRWLPVVQMNFNFKI
jgi:hypothetical protein